MPYLGPLCRRLTRVVLSGPVLTCLSAVVLVVCPGNVFAETFRIIDQSASATGQGGAFVAQADDPSALHFNPAGMTQLDGVQFSFGTNFAGGGFDFSGPLGSTSGDFDGTILVPPPSNLYLTANLGRYAKGWLENLSVGIGVNSPFGLQTRYPDDAPFNTDAIRAFLPLLDIKPTFAYKVNKYLSFGAGVDIYTFSNMVGEGQFELHRFNPPPAFGGIPGVGTGIAELNGDDTTPGYNVSMFVTPWFHENGKPRLNLGVVYRSEFTMHLDGALLVDGEKKADAETRFPFPDVLSVGLAYWPIRDHDNEWKVEVDLDYIDWSDFDKIDVKFSNAPPGTPPSISDPQEWENSVVVIVGSEYKWLNLTSLPHWDVAVRAGYVRSDTPVPDKGFTAAIPDNDYNAFSVGAGFTCRESGRFFGFIPCDGIGKAIGVDLAYQAIIHETRTVTGNLNPTVNGTYETEVHVGALNVRLAF